MAKDSGVKLHACSPTMGFMDVKEENLIPEEFHDVGKNIKINFTTENENIVTTTGKTEMNDIQLIQIHDTELWNKMANDNPVSMYMESI